MYQMMVSAYGKRVIKHFTLKASAEVVGERERLKVVRLLIDNGFRPTVANETTKLTITKVGK